MTAAPAEVPDPAPRTRPAQPAPAVPARRRPLLRLVPSPARQAPRAPFVVLIILLLGGGLLGLLVLNTQRAQDAFRLADLHRSAATLQDREQALEQEVRADQDPAALAARAAALGMVAGNGPAFVGEDGRPVGVVPAGAPVPGPASLRQGGVVVASAPEAPQPTRPAVPRATPTHKAAAARATAVPQRGATPFPTSPATPAAPTTRRVR